VNSHTPHSAIPAAPKGNEGGRTPHSEFRTPHSTRGFWALIVTQFQGAFSDNVVKNLVVFVALFGGTLTLAEKNSYGESIAALFSLPFILFSMAGGFLADRFSKRSVMLGVKVFELLIMSLVFAGLWTWNKNLLLASVFLMGTHSAIFGPSKYGSLPELLPERKLSWGNGILELGTFMAIILGTVAAALMAEHFRGHQWYAGVVLVALAVIGFGACLGVTKIPAADPQKKFNPNFPAEIWRQISAMRGDRPLWLSLAGNTYFNFLGMLLLLNLFFYGTETLHVSETHIGLLNVALALGIGLGSVAAGFLSGGKIEYGLVPLGAFGLSIFSALLAQPSVGLNESFVLLALLGFAGGFFIVPIAALLQHRPARDNKGAVQATANWCSFVGVFAASGAHWLLAQKFHLTPRGVFFVGGLLTFAGAVYVLILLPDSLLRFALWCVTHSIYKIRIVGRDHVPDKGGALFVCNHVSYVDALLLLAATDRPVRFLMFKDIYEKRWVKPFAKILGTIPVSSEQRPRELLHALQAASDAIRNGEVVCIFAEGQITRIGQLLPFRRGMERIMKDVDAPVIPVALDGVLGGPLSFKRGKLIHLITARCPHPVTVSFGKPMPATTTPFAVREAVQELQVNAWSLRRERMQPLHRNFIRMAREHPHRFAFADATTPKISFGTALVKTIFLARRLKKVWRGQGMVGLYLPPSVGGALANYAAFLCGKVPVNLNYTLSEATLADCVRQCEIKTVVTSRKFIEKIKLTPPGELIYLEDLAAKPSLPEKITALLFAKFAPAFLIENLLFEHSRRIESPLSLDNLATVIFSSGSTGEPKGVMLSQFNLLANIEQCGEVIALDEQQRILGILPFFHSFGFTVTLCLPLVLGTGVVFYPNPLDARGIGGIVRQHEVTVMLATATFLQIYLRGTPPEDFGSLKLIVTGAEKLPQPLAAAFAERFGIRPFEGYGCTECAPAVAVNSWDYRAAGFYQVGGKHGKIGQPVPGMCVRIADAEKPWSGKILPPGESGLLLVRGPNIMLGYLNQPEKTADVLRDGWYCTGDMAMLDDDGFLQITGRLNRFSKIGGEMVPHLKIEEKLQELAGVAEVAFVVLGLPDEKKGERLVVLHKIPDESLPALLEQLAACDLPNLWKPKADAFYRVENFPVLGTGKLDLRGAKELAASLAGVSASGSI
jgi:acyl-[acyl-carrier-protein]-phospholipid O-acyltransferase / long-chain-fatty-acid--[acyl-carrier-protein] ligase